MISPHFNPNEPEAEFYNEKYETLDLYPSINLANSNAFAVLRALHLEAGHSGEIEFAKLPFLREFLQGLRLSDPTQTKGDVITRYLPRLDELVSLAISLEDSIIWG